MPPGGFAALGPEWAALWRRLPDATPFAAPEWLIPWARHHAPGRAVAATLRSGGRLVGLLPVFAWEGALLLAGTGPSDRGDILLEPGFEASVPALLTALPGAATEPFDRIDLRQLPPTSPLLRGAPPGWVASDDEPCLVAPLDGKDGLGRASKRQRSNWRYAIRRIEREGGSLGLVPAADTGAAMDDLLRLHAARWAEKGQAGVLANPRLGAFLREAAEALLGAGLLRFHALSFGGERAAVLLVLSGRRTHHYYIGGFDPARARLSPSAALIGAAMARAHAEGAVALDFLRGAEAYKAAWGARPSGTRRLVLRRG